MYLGTQNPARTDAEFRRFAQLGVVHVCADPPGNPHHWTLDQLVAHRERLAGLGLVLDMVQLPMNSRPIEQQDSPDILSAGPDREAQLDSITRLIERIGAAGIPSAKYNLNIIGIPRSADEAGRGGSRNSSFRWEKMDQAAPATLAGIVGEDENWRRIEYFLDRVVPVAEASRVRLACHPHDPWTPPGYRGVTRVLGTLQGLQRFVEMRESQFHGLNFCIGTVAENMDDPRTEMPGALRWFGERGKLFNIHYRNIRGAKLSFMEVFPDEGDVDMVEALRVLAEVGYPYMVMPDHVPSLDADPDHAIAFAYCFGYIRALMQALSASYPGRFVL
jgi:mannonate dehydratase